MAAAMANINNAHVKPEARKTAAIKSSFRRLDGGAWRTEAK
jgi:hypothetical protein